MKIQTWWRIPVLVGVLIAASGAASSTEDVASAIKAVTIQNLKATQAEDMEAMLKTIHTQSPGYLMTKQQTAAMFENYDLKYDLVSFKYIGMDGEYAVARANQRTTKVSGPAFQNNDLDLIAVFRKEGGKWKFWNQVVLEVKYVNESTTNPQAKPL